MDTVDVQDAAQHLSRLVESVERGESFTLTRAGRPVGRLVPVEGRRTFGVLDLTIPADFDAPLPEAERALWE